MAAIRAYADRVFIDDVIVSDTALTGISVIGNGTTIRDTTVTNPGFIGIHGHNADNLRVEQTLVKNANTARFDDEHSASGMKVTKSRHVHVEGNEFASSRGPGIWVDQDAYNVTVVRNYVHDSVRSGIEIELTGKGVIAGNVVTNSGERGIWMLDSNDMEIWNNTLVKNYVGIETYDGSRDATDVTSFNHDERFAAPQPGITWKTEDIAIRNNVIVDGKPSSSIMLLTDDHARTSNATASGISSNYNVFARAVATSPQYIGKWASAPNGLKTGTTLAAFQTATGQDLQSVGYDAPLAPVLVNQTAKDFRAASFVPPGVTLPSAIASLLHVPGSTFARGALESPTPGPPPVFTPPDIAVGDATVTEGDSGTRSLSFPVTLTDRAMAAVTATYAVTVGPSPSATPTADFTLKSGTLRFTPSGSTGLTPTSKYVTVVVKPDTAIEGDERIQVQLSNVVNATVVRAVGIGTINNDDATTARRVSIGSARLNEGDTGSTRTVSIWVTLNTPSTSPLTVRATVSNGSAVAGADFVQKPATTISFAPGQYKKPVAVRIHPDVSLEGDETINVTLSSPSTGLSVYRGTGTITIGNDD
jgi:parallel beta-helix repeat protein